MSKNFVLKDISPVEFITAAAAQAIIAEASVFPKPGLVDPVDSGSHKDMNFFTFIKSASSLTEYFKICTEKGFHAENITPDFFAALRKAGMEAEKKMFLFTNGINTHKGAIFSIGLIAASAGYCFGKNKPLTPENILKISALIVNNIENELKNSSGKTAGEKIYIKHGITGIRGEASKGYPTIIKTAIPAFNRYISEKCDLNRALAGTLIEIMAETDDTNVISRGGIEALVYVKKTARQFAELENILNDTWKEDLEQMNNDFKKKNLSPGGSADLLAATIFIMILSGFEL